MCQNKRDLKCAKIREIKNAQKQERDPNCAAIEIYCASTDRFRMRNKLKDQKAQ